MSQIYKALTSGPVPPSVATSYVTDNGTAIPVANVLRVLGTDSSDFHPEGIQTSGLGNVLDIIRTNHISGTVTTPDATVTTIITFPLLFNGSPLASAWLFDCDIVGLTVAPSTIVGLACGFNVFGVVRSDGLSATIVQTPDKLYNRNNAIVTSDSNLSTSGNNMILTVTGVVDYTIKWRASVTYTLVT